MSNTTPQNRLVPLNEAAEIIGFRSRTSVYKLIAAGELVPIKRGRNTLFLESELLTYIQRLAAQSEAA